MRAQLFRTVRALQIIVCLLRKPLRMQIERYFPPKQQCDRQRQKTPRVAFSDKKQRREHHSIIPIVYPTGTAAFVLHEPCLEGTEEKDADDITNGIYTAQQDHNSVIQNPYHMQRPKDPVKNNPYKRDQHCGIIVRDGNISAAGFYVVAGKLFLASGALIF